MSFYRPLFIGTSHIHLESIDSTNTFISELLSKNDPPEGLVVSADYQTAGRGQYGRKWSSDLGQNALFSVLLKPHFLALQDAFYLNMVSSLSIQATLESYGISNIHIKWPNDIYINDAKIAGILTQNTLQHKHLKYTILGIGLNVNQQSFSLPNATSIAIQKSEHIAPNNVIDTACYFLEQYYLILKSGNKKNILTQYNELLYRKNKNIVFQEKNQEEIKTGTIVEVDAAGNLWVQASDGLKKYQVGDITFK